MDLPFVSIPVAAEILGITERRVRQHIEQGHIPRKTRGMVDLSWLIYYRAGAKAAENSHIKIEDPNVLVALAWAVGSGDEARKEHSLLVEMFTSNGKPESEALIALGEALRIKEN